MVFHSFIALALNILSLRDVSVIASSAKKTMALIFHWKPLSLINHSLSRMVICDFLKKKSSICFTLKTLIFHDFSLKRPGAKYAVPTSGDALARIGLHCPPGPILDLLHVALWCVAPPPL